MKKVIIALLVALLCVLLIFTGCSKNDEPAPASDPQGSSQPAEENSWERVQKAGKLVAGVDDAFPPMGFRNEKGELVGFDIDMAKEISKKIGVEITWQPTIWDTVVASLKGKKFDVIISGMNITKERLEEVNFAGPYGKSGQILIVKGDNDKINSIEDVEAGKLGTQSGSTGHKVANNAGFTDDQIKLYKEYPLAFNDLEIGRIDAIVCDAFAIRTYVEKKPGIFKHVGEQMGGDDALIGIAVRKEDKELLDVLNKAIKELIDDGTLSSLSEKWLGFDMVKDLK